MNKRAYALAGIGLTAAASFVASSPAGAAPAKSAQTTAVHYAAIRGSSQPPSSFHCGYPARGPYLTLGPNPQTAVKGRNYNLGGFYGCGGHPLPGRPVKLRSGTPVRKGICTQTNSRGVYTCTLRAEGNGNAVAIAPFVVSKPVALSLR